MSDHRVALYYQTIYASSLPANNEFGHYVSPLPLLQLVTHMFLAAFHINNDRSVHLNDDPPEAPKFTQMWSELGQMQASGIKVIGMLGGAAAGSYSNLASDFDAYYPPLRDYIQDFGLDGMDLDVEQSTNIATVEKLITQLKSDFGADFIITLAPVASALTEGGNLSGFNYIQLEAAMGSQISWYNAQFYSGFGSINPIDQYISIIEYKNGLSPSRVVAGTLTSSANGGGFISIDRVAESVRELSAKYTDFGGIFGWEYFNSLPGGTDSPWEWAETMKSAMAEGVAARDAKNNAVAQPRLARLGRVTRDRA